MSLNERGYFEELSQRLFGALHGGEHLFLNLAAEQTQFLRINGAKARQIGTVADGLLSMTYLHETQDSSGKSVLRKASRNITLSGISYTDRAELYEALAALRREAPTLPPDPYATLPANPGASDTRRKGELLAIDAAPEALLEPAQGADIAGIYASGPMVRAMANSAGLLHWFSTESFTFDYSLYTPSQRAVKATFAGQKWNQQDYSRSLAAARERLGQLEKAPRRIERGTYRAYLAPAAVQEIVNLFSGWATASEASLRQGESPFRKLRAGEATLSPRFTLSEDFSEGLVPRFNSMGELAPERLPLIERGQLRNTLVSSRSAKEYGAIANGAEESETLRAPAIGTGSLKESEILARLGTGLYLSNLHYLNWSDKQGGRITGMTRYACFWVEKGRIVAPIENMRFDDTIFGLLGSALEDLTETAAYEPETGSYYLRQLGGSRVPGALLSEMRFTL
ncbi:MAG: metallopeptidase TldD-related protein [Oligoflexia bacterium]|nr:metallopeptidase TldD-related protein [Oligoflexia bacterium]